MKLNSTIPLLIFGLLCISGCDDSGLGGGASQATAVVVLPPDLRSGAESPTAENGTGTGGPSASSPGGAPGNFSGRVVLTGGAPALSLIHAKGADIKDAAVCSAEDMPNEKLIIGTDNGVANVFIFIKRTPKGTPKPVPTEEAVIFDQKSCRFRPHCLIVPVGQTVKVLSGDDAAHNTHTNPNRNNSVSTLVGANDREGKLELVYKSSEREPFSVICDLHTWMNAWHFPVDHPYAALTDANGHFEIMDLPSGDHEFIVWHEAAKGKFVNRKLTVTITAGETTSQTIEYAASQLNL